LPALHAVRWPAHRRGRIHRRNLTCHKPVEQVLNRGKALFDGRGRSLASQLLDVGGDVQRLHVGDRRDAGAFAPGQKFPNRLRVGAARVPVANVGSEEFPETGLGVVAGRDNQGGDQQGRGGEGSDVVHVSVESEMLRKNSG
jgi:hypothetical protein